MRGKLGPKEVWEPAGVEECPSALQDRSVQTLCDAVVLRSVVHGKFLFNTFRFEVLTELGTCELTTTVGM